MTEPQIELEAARAASPADDLGSLDGSDTVPASEARLARPAGVPEKFWDVESGVVRTEALLKSYLELERKLGSMVPLPTDEADQEGHARLMRLLGVPEGPEQYQIEPRHELIAADPEINARLHEAGFTKRQAQLVYDLAADHLVPLLDEAVAELSATRDVERLAARFGGPAPWRTTAQQIKTWGEANLTPDVFATLASNYDGVLAIHQMMQAREPAVLSESNGTRSEVDEGNLARMMRDPRYWRERDPSFVAQVTEGFRRLYPSQN
jgi:hypothetical protein